MTTQVDHNALDDDAFRLQWRAWIAQHYRSELRNPLKRLTGAAARDWLSAQYRDGWRAPGLPREFGGMGLSPRKQLIYQEELERFGVARPMDMGLRLLAPVLIRYGSAEQKALLHGILSGEDVWCQGYSEPNAGSDLANLKTAAVRDGDELVINGQKIWTTLATDSNKIFMLVRTSSEAKKQQGITFVLADMNTPGIQVRPIRTLAGDEHFCEVFFENARVPLSHVVGDIGDGWRVGKALLGFERFSHGSPELVRYAFDALRQTGAALGLRGDPHYQDLIATHGCDVADANALYEQVCATVMAGGQADEEVSMLKLFNAELLQRIAESASELAGQCAGVLGDEPCPGLHLDLEWLYMISRPLTIFGGTAQLQRNLIATGALQLPRS